MARYLFKVGKAYAGRLQRCSERPIENSTRGLHLLRFEFEIFTIAEPEKQLRSTGKIACRDAVLGAEVDLTRDSSLTAYATALRLGTSTEISQWSRLSSQKTWVTIVFGEVGKLDMRNAFAAIHRRDPAGWTIREYDYNLRREWVSVGEAADDLGVSESTIRRFLKEMESEWGDKLVRRTDGKHRRICLPLLRNLWRDEL